MTVFWGVLHIVSCNFKFMNRFIRIALASSALAALSSTSILAQNTGTKPALTAITPSESQTIYGDKVPILLSVENFEIVDYAQYPTLSAGLGHVHLWLDEASPTRESAAKVTDDNFTYSDVAYGSHILKAELVNNNHTSLTPPVATTINFKTAPAIAPSPAATSGFDKNTALVILVVVALVIVAAWWYTKEEDETPTKSSTVKKSTRKKASKRRKK